MKGARPGGAPAWRFVGLALGLSPNELGMTKHIVRPTSVIDWSASVVAAA